MPICSFVSTSGDIDNLPAPTNYEARCYRTESFA